MNTKTTLLIIFFAVLGLNLSAQNTKKCSAHDHRVAAIETDPSILDKINASEEAIANFIENEYTNKKVNAVVTIPVVIHIIHDGEAIGSGTNISDAQAINQITRLNEDFRKMNADTLDATHPFYGLQADTEIEFCLANIDPDGNPTTGITRYDGGFSAWDEAGVDEIIKPATIWNPDEYMNIWSIEIDDPLSPGLDGWGTFPTSTSDTTDGIVVKYDVFGDFGGDKSIVATHEVGHYLNLNHIWGDNEPNCGDDLVNDTPAAAASNEFCPTFPHNANSACGTDANGEMFMNYMDYSDPECTVMFTPGQKARMLATLNTSRASLLTSGKCDGTTGLNDNILESKLAIYPNPNTGKFTIELNDIVSNKINIQVFNYAGAVVRDFQEAQNATYQIDLSELSVGIYFVHVNVDNQSISKKVIITK